MNKAKSILLDHARKLKSKAAQKRREADKLDEQAAEFEVQAETLK